MQGFPTQVAALHTSHMTPMGVYNLASRHHVLVDGLMQRVDLKHSIHRSSPLLFGQKGASTDLTAEPSAVTSNRWAIS
jgi:hypothetical protein